ncbi:MAG: PdxA family protein, partial [Fibrobacterota bacterium]
KDAVNLVKKDRVKFVIDQIYRFYDRICINNPKIGVAGLNPHAGESGLFGEEEQKEIIPAVMEMIAEGHENLEGPVPPDVIFARQKNGVYDGVVAMYHDQGHIAFKTLLFSIGPENRKTAGVNVTLGLPFVRTSVDHGTSYDIAGKGAADCGSFLDAAFLAVKMIINTEKG